MAIDFFKIPKGKRLVDAQEWQKECYDDPAQIKIICSPRGSGKSVYTMCETLRIATDKKKLKQLCWIVLPTREMAKDIYWSELKEIISFMGFKQDVHFKANETDLSITFLFNKSKISLKSADKSDKGRLVGRRISFVACDEYSIFSDKDIWDKSIEPSMLPDAKAVIVSTPNSYDKFFELFQFAQEDKTGKYKSWHFNVINSTIDGYDKKVAEAKLKLSDAMFRQEYEAEFVSFASKVYLDFSRDIHTTEIPLFNEYPLSIAWDFNVNPMMTVIAQIIPKEKLIEYNIKIKDGYELQDEVILVYDVIKGENTNVQNQCYELQYYLQQIDWKGFINFYGDATGQGRSATQTIDENSGLFNTSWNIIQTMFPDASFNYDKCNPLQINRINVMNNKILANKNRIGFICNSDINLNAEIVTKDLEQVSWQENGRQIDKRKERIGIGHSADAINYLVSYEFSITNSTPNIVFI